MQELDRVKTRAAELERVRTTAAQGAGLPASKCVEAHHAGIDASLVSGADEFSGAGCTGRALARLPA